MGNNDHRSQQVHTGRHNSDRMPGGLKPTNGQDAYKRALPRPSRRSERTSYMMATGHLDPEETQHLNRQSPTNEFIELNRQLADDSPVLSSVSHGRWPGTSSAGDNTFLEFPTAYYLDNTDDRIMAHNKKLNPSKSRLSATGKGSSNTNRTKFKQTYTEVTLPMKTSPAFEYILKDDRRRYRRCCLWMIYSMSMTILIAIIIFCLTHLALRYQNYYL